MRIATFVARVVACGFAVTLLAAGCNDDEVGVNSAIVGGSCRSNGDCDVDSYCQGGGDFPDGMCTFSCRFVEDCPVGSVCGKKEGGICMPECTFDADCRGGYKCKDQDRQDGGKALVCKK